MFRGTLLPLACASFALTACASGEEDPGPDGEPCTPGAVTLEHTTTTAYACGEPFRAIIRLTNGGCSTAVATGLDIAGEVISCSVATCVASCASPPGSTTGLCPYDLAVSIPAGQTRTVMDLTGDGYHYNADGGFQMVERYTYTVAYTLGGESLTVSASPVDVTVTLPVACP